MIEAVIFDCDGVLVDSESLAWEAWRPHAWSSPFTPAQFLTAVSPRRPVELPGQWVPSGKEVSQARVLGS